MNSNGRCRRHHSPAVKGIHLHSTKALLNLRHENHPWEYLLATIDWASLLAFTCVMSSKGALRIGRLQILGICHMGGWLWASRTTSSIVTMDRAFGLMISPLTSSSSSKTDNLLVLTMRNRPPPQCPRRLAGLGEHAHDLMTDPDRLLALCAPVSDSQFTTVSVLFLICFPSPSGHGRSAWSQEIPFSGIPGKWLDANYPSAQWTTG